MARYRAIPLAPADKFHLTNQIEETADATSRDLRTEVDARFRDHFRGLKQVFLYVTDECNLRCRQCYYKPWLKTGHAEMDTNVMLALLGEFRKLGAIKLSLLGGEPSLYGQAPGNRSLPEVVVEARRLGFEYIRIVTNGLFDTKLLDTPGLSKLDEITFSIDGHTAQIHDSLRGRGTFGRSMKNLKGAVERGFNVHVTTCVHRGNAGRNANGTYMIGDAIHWAGSVGASLINFHPLFKMNIPRDSWSGPTDIDPREWVEIYRAIRRGIDGGLFPISVRLPQRFVTSGEFEESPAHFGFCPVKLAERIEVHANGQIHSCALNNGTPISIARFENRDSLVSITWSDELNELSHFPFDFSRDHPCAVNRRGVDDLVPLCISFKPEQEEFIWRMSGWS